MEIEISELTFDQVNAYFVPVDRTDEMNTLEYSNAVRLRTLEMICNSLNNVLQAEVITEGAYEEGKWTPARFCSHYGAVTFRRLNEAILTFSGLTLEAQSTGGANADADPTLATSAPALQPLPASDGGK